MDAQQSVVPVMVLALWPPAQTVSKQPEFDESNDPTVTDRKPGSWTHVTWTCTTFFSIFGDYIVKLLIGVVGICNYADKILQFKLPNKTRRPKGTIHPKMSVIIYSPSWWWKVRWSFSVHSWRSWRRVKKQHQHKRRIKWLHTAQRVGEVSGFTSAVCELKPV